MKVQPIYNNSYFKKGLEFAADNGSLFVASTALALSTVARPIAIMLTPNTDKKNKEYAASKSIASSAIGYSMMLIASLPLAKAIKKIDKHPENYLTKETLKSLNTGTESITKSSKYKFATQLLKLGLGFIIAVPKSLLTCALLPSVMQNIFGRTKDDKKFVREIPFKGLEKPLSNILNTKLINNLTKKFYKTDFELHIMSLTDSVATGAFIAQTSKSKKIDNDRKKALMANAGISTAMCISSGYAINALSRKSTDNFITKFKAVNKNSPKLDKYVEGIKVAKPALILGSLYYIIIPLISTFIADKTDKL